MRRGSYVMDNEHNPLDEETETVANTPQETQENEACEQAAAAPAEPPIIEGEVIEIMILSGDEAPDGHPHGLCLGLPIVLRQGLLGAWAVLTLLLVLVLVADKTPGLLGPLAPLLSGLAPSATVTILPAQMGLSTTMTITTVTNAPDWRRQQIQARLLSGTSPTYTQTVQTTGRGHMPAQQAQGTLIFYNAAPYEQTIAAGTVLTGTDGVQVVTEQAAVIPAGNPPTEGQVTIAAHAVQPGPRGNIAALDFNGACCATYVLVQNAVPFSGGHEARDYHIVLQQDIDQAVGPLATALIQQTQTTLQAQMRSNEQFVAPAHCRPAVRTDHAAGNEATQVTVTVMVTCIGTVYDQQEVQQIVTDRLTKQALATMGNGYGLQGAVTTIVKQVTPLDAKGPFALMVKAEGVWMYQFSAADIRQFTTLVVGRHTQDATHVLLQQGYVRAVSIALVGGDGMTLPADPTQIRVVLLGASGA